MPLGDPHLFVDGAARRRRNLAWWLLCVNFAVALLLSALAWQGLQRTSAELQAQATSAAEGLAAVGQLNIQSEMDRIDGVLRATAAELERMMTAISPEPRDVVFKEVLAARHGLLSGVEGFRLTDAAGLVRWGTGLAADLPIDVSDRAYFREAKALRERRTLVAGPLTSRVSGNWVIAFTYPLRVNGGFAGVLYVSVNADHFRGMFEQYQLGPLDAVALRSNEHRLVARFANGSAAQGQPGDVSVSPELAEHLALDPHAGHFVSRGLIDGEERTSAYRSLKSWPFVVLAGVSNSRYEQAWREQAMVVVSLSGLAWLLTAGGTWLLYLSSRREEVVMRALANQGKRIQALLRTAGDSIHITDRSGHLVEMSDSFAEMLKSSRENLLGRHISSWDVNQNRDVIDAWLARIKPGDRQRVDVQHRRDDGHILDVEMQLSVVEIAGELLVFSSSRDVTSQRRLMREQTAMLNNDLVGMAKIENRRITWRNCAVERILGYGEGELQGQHVQLVYWDEAEYARVGIEGYERLQRDGRYRSQLRMRTKSGEPLWIDFGAVPLSQTEIFVMLVDITEMKRAHETLAYAAFHDALTGLPNRLLLDDRVVQARAIAARDRRGVAICYLDLDGFKAVNDGHGHDAGDQLLKTIGLRIRAAIRPCDTAARLGGDEFVLVIAELTGDEWEPIIDRIVQAINEPIALASRVEVKVGVTVGVTVASFDDPASSKDLIERADRTMLRAKRSGKGRVLRSAR